MDCGESMLSNIIGVTEPEDTARLRISDSLLDFANVAASTSACKSNEHTIHDPHRYMWPIYSKSEKMNVFSRLKPQAMISFAFSLAYL